MNTLLKKGRPFGSAMHIKMLSALLVAVAVLVAACGSQPGTSSGSPGTASTSTPVVKQTGIITEFPLPSIPSAPKGITAGPDGNLWFAGSFASGLIGRITPTGQITEFPCACGSDAITAGRDGNLWFTEADANQIGRITPTGTVTEFPIPTFSSQSNGITTGPDGNVWFTELGGNRIGRITPTGQITEFPVPTASSEPLGITAGPDGNLWFTEFGGSKIGRITSGK